MKAHSSLYRCVVGIVALLALVAQAAPAQEAQPVVGVVIAAHGAPMDEWNKTPKQLADDVNQQIQDQGLNMVARIGFLEFTQPSIADAVADLRGQGIERIVVVPLFVSVSEHTILDLPCVLGTMYHPKTMEVLAEEGAELVPAGTPLIVAPALCCSGLFPKIMLERARELSEDPANESVLVFAHGSPNFAPIWNKQLTAVTKTLLDEGGFKAASYAFVGVGHGASEAGLAAISEAAAKADRTIIIGLYVAMGADLLVKMFHGGGGHGAGAPPAATAPTGAHPNAVASGQGLLPHPDITEWVIRVATDAARLYDAPVE